MIRNILQLQADRNLARRVVDSVADSEDIIRCMGLVDQGFKRFEVSMILDALLCV
jgi:hypothetical protein